MRDESQLNQHSACHLGVSRGSPTCVGLVSVLSVSDSVLVSVKVKVRVSVSVRLGSAGAHRPV